MEEKCNVQDFHSETPSTQHKEFCTSTSDLVTSQTTSSFLSSPHVSNETLSLAHLTAISQNSGLSLNSRSTFQIELHSGSHGDQHLPALWFTTNPVRSDNPFNELNVQSIQCSPPDACNALSSTSDLVQVCMPLANYHPSLQAIETGHDSVQSLDNGSLNATSVAESCLVSEKKQDLSKNDCSPAVCNSRNDAVTTINSIYSVAPSQLMSGEITASVKSNQVLPSSLHDSTIQCAGFQRSAECPLGVSNTTQVSLIDLGEAGQVDGNVQSHLQAEIVYRDSRGEISRATGTVQIPIIRSDVKYDDDVAKCSSTDAGGHGESGKSVLSNLVNCDEGSNVIENNDCLQETKVEGFVETVECFKCKLCPYISLDKKGVQEHIESDHAQACRSSDNSESDGDASYNSEYEESMEEEIPTGSANFIKMSESNASTDSKYVCGRCEKSFVDFEACNAHVLNDHEDGQVANDILEKMTAAQRDLCGRKERGERGSKRRRSGNRKEGCEDKLLSARRKQKVPRKMHPNDSPKDEGRRRKIRNKRIYFMDGQEEEGEETIERVLLSPKMIGPLKKRGRPKGSKNTGITALRRKNPKLKLDDELGYRCDVDGCAIRMKSIDNLDYHRRCHVTDEVGFTCPECPEKFDHWRNISVHLWRIHVIDMELYACDQCSYKTYSFSKLMNMHKRIHSEDRPFLCDNCGKGFKTSKQLRNHKVIHLDKRRQRSFRSGECDVCHRFFSDKRMLRVHKDTVHNKLRPFLCNYCGYAASCRSTLKMHMRQHTGEKPFSCSFCAYRTADHNSLRRHKMRHSGEKPYKCPFCPYACIQSSTYKTHLKNKHPGQDEGLMYSCDLCAFRTIKKENYITHMADHKAGAIPINPSDHTTILVEKHCSPEQHTVLLQTSQAIPTLTQIDRLPNNLTTAQVMLSTLEEIRNKIALATQGFPLEVSQSDRYPILVGQLKTTHLDNTTVVHLDPTIHLDSSHVEHQQFLVQESVEHQLVQSDSSVQNND